MNKLLYLLTLSVIGFSGLLLGMEEQVKPSLKSGEEKEVAQSTLAAAETVKINEHLKSRFLIDDFFVEYDKDIDLEMLPSSIVSLSLLGTLFGRRVPRELPDLQIEIEPILIDTSRSDLFYSILFYAIEQGLIRMANSVLDKIAETEWQDILDATVNEQRIAVVMFLMNAAKDRGVDLKLPEGWGAEGSCFTVDNGITKIEF